MVEKITRKRREGLMGGNAHFRSDIYAYEAALSAAEERIEALELENADLKVAKIFEMSDEQVFAMFGGPDAAEEVAQHVNYVMRVARQQFEYEKKIEALERRNAILELQNDVFGDRR